MLVHARLRRGEEAFATQGAIYWIVSADLSGGTLSGLSTVVSGDYIEAIPGTGERVTEFVGYDKPPVLRGKGLYVTLYANRLEHLQQDSPVYYRGIQVGAVKDVHLSDDSTRIEYHVFIQNRYTPLVRSGSEFWQIAGIDLEGGIFSGLKLQIGPLRTLLAGGIEFATPDDKTSIPVKDGAEFVLNDEPKKEWSGWAPQIKLLPSDAEEAAQQQESGSEQPRNAMQTVNQAK